MPVKKCLILSVDKWLKLFACYNVDTRSILIGRHQRREREREERVRERESERDLMAGRSFFSLNLVFSILFYSWMRKA